jgi:membrane fusion protein, multidrug efflux system
MNLRLLALAATLLTLVACPGCSKPNGPSARPSGGAAVPVTVARVEMVPLDRTISIVGTLYPKDEATVAAQVEGQVEQTRVDFGDRVSEGQELARIDTTAYDSLARQAAANLERARASAANAEQNLQRVRLLRTDKIASASQFDEAEAQAKQGRAEVSAAEAADAIAELNLARSRVKSPFDGAVAERIASAGDYLKVGSPLFRLVNDAVLKFIFQVPERHASFVTKKLPVQFSVDNFPGETFTGSVYLISPAVSTATRAFNVGALVTNTDFRLKANTFARGRLTLEHAVPTAMVPLDAVVSFAGVTKVFVVEGDVARARSVEAGRIQDGRQEILDGLRAGERVVTSGQTQLSDGTKVVLQSATLGQDDSARSNSRAATVNEKR